MKVLLLIREDRIYKQRISSKGAGIIDFAPTSH